MNPLSLILILFIITITSSASLSPNSLILYKQGHALKNSKETCRYELELTQKIAILNINCPQNPEYIVKFNVSLLDDQPLNTYVFKLTPFENSNLSLPLSQQSVHLKVQLEVGLQWAYQIQFSVGKESYTLMDSFSEHEYKVVLIFLAYLLLSLLILPIGKIYYKNIEGISIYSLIVSIQLSIWLAINIFSSLLIFSSIAFQTKSLLTILSSLLMLVCLIILFYHEKQKISKLHYLIDSYEQTPFNKHLLMIVSLLVCLLGVLFIYNSQKTIFFFVYFMSGSVIYMASFLIFKKMKKHFFSYRLILFDAASIGAIALTNSYYPINNFWIFSTYKMFAVYLMLIVLIIGGGLVYILVNIVRKQLKENKEKKGGKRKKRIMSQDLQLSSSKKLAWKNAGTGSQSQIRNESYTQLSQYSSKTSESQIKTDTF